MAQHFYGLSRGSAQGPTNVTVGTVDTGKEVQIVVVDGTADRKEVAALVEAILSFYVSGGPSGNTNTNL